MDEGVYVIIEVARGDTLYREWELYQSDGVSPLDISTFALTGSVKADPNGASIATLACSCKVGTKHTLVVELSATLCEAIPTTGRNFAKTENYLFDVKADTGSTVEKLIRGPFRVTPRITA